jgi:hypothetical protein
MKIKFHQLPKEEQLEILDVISDLTSYCDNSQERLHGWLKEVEYEKSHLARRKRELQSFKDKYDFE